MNRSLAIVVAKLALGGSLALGFMVAPHGYAHADTYAMEVGDDNGDGVVMEDESGWDCVSMGNHVCGPDNPQGVPAGRWEVGPGADDVLVNPWPLDPSCKDVCLGA